MNNIAKKDNTMNNGDFNFNDLLMEDIKEENKE